MDQAARDSIVSGDEQDGKRKKGTITASDKKAPLARTGGSAKKGATAAPVKTGASTTAASAGAKKDAKAPAAPKAPRAARTKAIAKATPTRAIAKAAKATTANALAKATKATAAKASAKATKATPAKAIAKATKATATKVQSLAAAAHKVSAADKARAESLLAEIGRRKERIVEDFYEIGLALRELAKKELFRALEYSSFEAMLDARAVMSLTTARRLIQLVSTMSRDEALAYGQEKALALLAYAKATPEVDTPKSLMQGGKLPGGKPIVTASIRELKEAAKQARASTGKGRVDPVAKQAATEAKALHTWLHARGLRNVKVAAVRAKEGYLVRVEMTPATSGKLRES